VKLCVFYNRVNYNMKYPLFWAAPVITVIGILFYHAYGNIRKLEDNWSAYRCNPMYMPFAGMVDPKTGTMGNFDHCMAMMGKEVMGSVGDALGSQFSIIEEALKLIENPLSLFRTVITSIRKFVVSFATSTLGKVTGPMSMFVYYLNKINDLFRRMVGEGYIAVFLGATAVGFMEGFVLLCFAVIKAFITGMLIISFILALFQPEILAIVLVVAALLGAAGI